MTTPKKQRRFTDSADSLRYYSERLPNGCLIWTGAVAQRTGYGLKRHEGRLMGVHRVAYILSHGPIPDGMEVDHLCFNRLCIEPDHLDLTTKRENLRRRNERDWTVQQRVEARINENLAEFLKAITVPINEDS